MAPAELYQDPQPEISQGDILDLAPNVYLDRPLLALKNETEAIYSAYGEPFEHFQDKTGQSIIAKCKRARAIVVTHDCEIDKPAVARYHICPVVPLSHLSSKMQDQVKRNRVYSRYFLPSFRDLRQDSFVDFNQISTVDRDLIAATKRLLTLSDLGRRGLYAQFIRWATRWELRHVTCPECQVDFEPYANVPVRSE